MLRSALDPDSTDVTRLTAIKSRTRNRTDSYSHSLRFQRHSVLLHLSLSIVLAARLPGNLTVESSILGRYTQYVFRLERVMCLFGCSTREKSSAIGLRAVVNRVPINRCRDANCLITVENFGASCGPSRSLRRTFHRPSQTFRFVLRWKASRTFGNL